ncbi:MAG: tetratricopeptide repeat protein, partial [Gammaproteobacteria bacterium]|nr:tetratricopeptide repeat protein [Gammaproteobacteria bacterium]
MRACVPGLLVLALVTITTEAFAQVNPRLTPPAVGKLVSAVGDVQLQRTGTSQWSAARAGTLLDAGDTLRTGDSGRASLLLADETLMQLHRNSTLRLKQVAQSAGWLRLAAFTDAVSSAVRSVYQLARGRLWARNNNRDVDVEFETAVVTAGVRGTELTLEVRADESVRTVVLEGAVEHRNAAGRIVANAGEQVITLRGQLPAKSVLLQPRDAVQWTLVIPPLAYFEELASRTAPASRGSAGTSHLLASAAPLLPAGVVPAAEPVLAQQSGSARRQELAQILALTRQQRYAPALGLVAAALRRTPSDFSLLTLRAILQLHLGEVAAADTQLQALAERQPDQALVWRYLAITRVMLDDGQGAVAASIRAVELQPASADNYIAQVYAYQSLFDLQKALAAARQAVTAEPRHVLANVTLARLLFGSGELERSRRVLTLALRLDPDNAVANNLAGFVALARRDLAAAAAYLERALLTQPSMAEPHLGLGIVAMRGADSALALEEISTAVLLDPQRSLFLSYWGKLLYQIKRFDKALQLLARAEQLDPNDPTPPFYRAIVLRDLNRQGEAIQALHSAIEKNDNRAVYRSRFLLDRDLAVRNVDLSLLYNQLGLQSWATRKAYAAVK